MSNNVWAGSPSFSASAKPSHTAIIEAARIMLLQILAVWPLPAGPAWTIVRPLPPPIGSAPPKAALSPPALKVHDPPPPPPPPPPHRAPDLPPAPAAGPPPPVSARRHCERSDAISCQTPASGPRLLRRSAPRNDDCC